MAPDRERVHSLQPSGVTLPPGSPDIPDPEPQSSQAGGWAGDRRCPLPELGTIHLGLTLLNAL